MLQRAFWLGISAVFLSGVAAAAANPGATLPWTTYEAEDAATNATILGPDFTGHTPAREASGRKCVRLSATGNYVQITAKDDAEGLVVRYCIPDSPDGMGISATLSLYINGRLRKKLPMSSRLCYLYGAYPYTNHPADGTPRHFWDELRLMPGEIHVGDRIRLQKDSDDSASEYLIDFIDLEKVPAPLDRPDESLSITDFGAVANSNADSHPAFVRAIAAAKAQHRSVWIPAGNFVVKGPIEVSNVAVHGAGMWYSTLVGAADYTPSQRVAVYGTGSNVTLSDFALVGNLNYRNDSEPNDGLGGSFGTGSVIRNVWVEHTKTGAWLVNSDGLLVEGCRFRDTIADGINLCVGMRNTTVRNCTARGGGDDCFAVWPTTYIPAKYTPGGNKFVHCTAQLPFLAQAFSIYGGDGNRVEDCQAIDIPYGAGLFASTTFPTEFGFRGITSYSHVRLVRTGDQDGAIGAFANRLDLPGLRFQDVDVLDSPHDAIKFTSIGGHAVENALFDRVRMMNYGLAGTGYGIDVPKNAVGSATLIHVSVSGVGLAPLHHGSSAFKLTLGEGSLGIAGD